MALTDAFTVTDESGTELIAVDQSGNTDIAGTLAVTGALTGSSTVGATSILCDEVVTAAITVAGGSGGATAGTMSIQLNQADETTAISTARQALVLVCGTQYAPFSVDANATTTFGAATTGTKIASGAGWCLFETDASGVFVCPPSNSADETVYFRVITAEGHSDPTDGCVVIGSDEASATWAA